MNKIGYRESYNDNIATPSWFGGKNIPAYLRKYLYQDLSRKEALSLLTGHTFTFDCATYLDYDVFQFRADLLEGRIFLFAIGSNDDHFIGELVCQQDI